MFAFVNFHDNCKSYYVPVRFIKRFQPTSSKDFEKLKEYKVFWCDQLERNQTKLDLLQQMEVPPKSSWIDGAKYYKAYILRLDDTLENLVQSVGVKRPSIPPKQFSNSSEDTTTDAEEQPSLKKLKSSKLQKKESAEKKRLSNLLNFAIHERTDLFSNLDKGSVNHDSRNEINNLKKRIQELEDENTGYKSMIQELQNCNEDLMKDNKEIQELRILNRDLQTKVINLIAEGNTIPVMQKTDVGQSEVSEDVVLGNGIVLKRSVYNAVKFETSISKFTKSLSVAIWGSDTLMTRSTTGTKCRNSRGCRRKGEEEESLPATEARPKLTPEKLSVVSALMIQYMTDKKMSDSEIELNLKKRNRFISEKISDLHRSTKRKMIL